MVIKPTAKPRRIMVILGTRPEAIKLAPVVHALQAKPRQFRTSLVVTAQHRDMLDPVLRSQRLTPDVDLNLMRKNQGLGPLTARALAGLGTTMQKMRPEMVLVQGDTTTTLAAAMAAFYQGIPVGHVEAGLRTHDRHQPFPEEANRRMVSVLADWHFAATRAAQENLLQEGITPERIFITGNPVVDALRQVVDPKFDLSACGLSIRQPLRLVVVTAHRRENFGQPLIELCRALSQLAVRYPRISFVFPVHRNPRVRAIVERVLRQAPPNLQCRLPMPYAQFINLVARAELVLTDSGGLQEEVPALGGRALVMREVTERPEALHAGVALVKPDCRSLVRAVARCLDQPQARPPHSSPFGDGRAAQRIVAALAWIFGQQTRRPQPFSPK